MREVKQSRLAIEQKRLKQRNKATTFSKNIWDTSGMDPLICIKLDKSNFGSVLDEALIHSSKNVLKFQWKETEEQTRQTIELLKICNKAAKLYKRTRNPEHKDQRQLLHGQVSADFDQDQQTQLDTL